MPLSCDSNYITFYLLFTSVRAIAAARLALPLVAGSYRFPIALRSPASCSTSPIAGLVYRCMADYVSTSKVSLPFVICKPDCSHFICHFSRLLATRRCVSNGVYPVNCTRQLVIQSYLDLPKTYLDFSNRVNNWSQFKLSRRPLCF